jgi:cytochrome b6-f complex iron-sulfur subunit
MRASSQGKETDVASRDGKKGRRERLTPPKQVDWGEPDTSGIDRRQFFGMVTACSLGVTGLGAAGAVGAMLVPPGRSIDGKTKMGPLALVAVADLPKAKPVPFEYGDDEVFVIKLASDKVTVLSAACPHVACKLHWDDAHQEFACPCHASFFTLTGVRKSGPAVRNMDPAYFTVENGKVVVTGIQTV